MQFTAFLLIYPLPVLHWGGCLVVVCIVCVCVASVLVCLPEGWSAARARDMECAPLLLPTQERKGAREREAQIQLTESVETWCNSVKSSRMSALVFLIPPQSIR